MANGSVKKAIKIKNNMFRKVKRYNDPDFKVIYNRFRNNLKGRLSRAEKEHYDKALKDNANNLKNSWRILKQIINKKQTNNPCRRFIINKEITKDSKK